MWRLVERHRVTNVFTVPTILKRLVESPVVEHRDHSSLRHVIYSGAPLHRRDKLTALARLSPVLVQHYGLVEVTANITVLPTDLHDTDDPPDEPVDTCGIERTGMQVSVQDDTGRELPPGEEGEICVCGPAVFAGYLDNPDANAAAFRDGWFRTGDIGRLDDRGYLYITGRLSDMYISGGSNIHPREVEEHLRQHPDITDATVVGVPDERWGEAGIAVCVARSPVDGTELLDWLRTRMTRYKVPKRVEFRPDLPRTAYGKVDRRAIRNALLD